LSLPRQQGQFAEQAAARYLVERGWRILCANYATRLGEVDLVAAKGIVLAFVEVRYRRSVTFGAPEDTVTKAKRRKVVLAALEYVTHHHLIDRAIRFDVIAVLPGRDGPKVMHIEDAFEAELSGLAPPPLL
jgi:putative endonuclease